MKLTLNTNYLSKKPNDLLLLFYLLIDHLRCSVKIQYMESVSTQKIRVELYLTPISTQWYAKFTKQYCQSAGPTFRYEFTILPSLTIFDKRAQKYGIELANMKWSRIYNETESKLFSNCWDHIILRESRRCGEDFKTKLLLHAWKAQCLKYQRRNSPQRGKVHHYHYQTWGCWADTWQPQK